MATKILEDDEFTPPLIIDIEEDYIKQTKVDSAIAFSKTSSVSVIKR